MPKLADRTVDLLRRYVSILVVGVLLLWLLPRAYRAAADAVRGRPLVSLGVGVLGFIGVVALLVWWSWPPCCWRSRWACWASGPSRG